MRKISAIGLLCLFLLAWASAVPTPRAYGQGRELLGRASEWRYDDSGSDQGAAWREAGFDDGGWAAGRGPLGYKEPDIATELGFGANPDAKHPTYYFRRRFAVANSAELVALKLQVRFDDGFAAYLNGQEVLRDNLTISTTVPYHFYARDGHDGSTYVSYDISPALALLREGENVLAVEVHQASANSSDMLFDAALLAGRSADAPMFLAGPALGQVSERSARVLVVSDAPTLAVVEYGTSPALGAAVQSAARATIHELTLADLEPGSGYYYRVGLRSAEEQQPVWSTQQRFTSDAGPGSSFSFGVWADSRPSSGYQQPEEFTANMRHLVERKPLALAVAIGDNVQLRNMLDDAQAAQGIVRQSYLAYYAALAGLVGEVPLYATLGNHDVPECGPCLAGFQSYVPNPQVNDERFYSFDYGGAHFVMLDSRMTGKDDAAALVGQGQLEWLERDLAASSSGYTFVFIHDALFHNQEVEIYSPEEKQRLHQLFLDEGVTAVFQGDAHYYDYYEQDGLPYIISGGAGSPLYDNPYNPDWKAHEALVVRVAPSGVTVEAIRAEDGSTLDKRELQARPAKGAQVAVATRVLPTPAPTRAIPQAQDSGARLLTGSGGQMVPLVVGLFAVIVVVAVGLRYFRR